MTDEGDHEHACPLSWLIDDIGRYLTDGGTDEHAATVAGRRAVQLGTTQVRQVLTSAFAADEVVATELRLTGPRRGARRTVFGEEPSPVALLLLCLRLCDQGDEVTLLYHTAGKGTTERSGIWPFGMEQAEQLTRPPVPAANLPPFSG